MQQTIRLQVRLKAFEVSGTGAASGTYFATSWPKALDGKDAIDLATPA